MIFIGYDTLMTLTPTSQSSSISSDEIVWSANDLVNDPHVIRDKAERVRRMFASIADSYDLNNRIHSFGLDQRWRRKTVRLCRVKPTDDVLDVACGTGDLSEAFADAHPASVRGLDFTEPMLHIARKKATGRSRSEGMPIPQYIQGDAMALPQADRSMDIVSIAFGIRNIADPVRALCEFHRVLRPGGRVAVLEFSEPANPLLRSLNRLYTRRIMPCTATLLARDRSGAYRYLPRSVATFHNRESFTHLLNEAGFETVRLYPLTFGACVVYLAMAKE